MTEPARKTHPPAAAPPPRRRTRPEQLWDVVTSLKLTIVCLSALMVLVVACTLAQVHLGTFGAVQKYMRSWLVWWDLPGTVFSLPVFPGGALAGLVLVVNLITAQFRRLELSWKKAGLWIVHAGLILLVAGEFVTGMYQRDDRLTFVIGESMNYLSSFHDVELAVITDSADPRFEDVHGIPGSRLARGGDIQVPGTPLTLRVQRYFENAQLFNLQPGQTPAATNGVGPQISIREVPPATSDDEISLTSAVVEPFAAGQSQGTFLVSRALGAPQGFTYEGKPYRLELRARREYLPYALTLRQFHHDVYPGTDTPKNFSSLVHVVNPTKGDSRDVLISMNQPLRYGGKAFYQASFGKNDTESTLQVVENPGWLLPYLSCVLVTLGLLVHFGISLTRWIRRQPASDGVGATALEA